MPAIEYLVQPPLGIITLNRPERRNALSAETIAELTDTLQSAAGDSRCRAVLLRARGPAFCAGMDLDGLRRMMELPYEANLDDSRRMAALLDLVWKLPKPVVAAVQGAALGGGCGLATVCDVTMAVREATFGFPEVKLGFVPAIVSVFLVRLIGGAHTRELLVTGRVVDATEAQRLGLVNVLVPAGELEARARELAEQLASTNGPLAMSTTKQLLGVIPTDELERAAAANASARATAECREGVTAFLDKRRPVWP